MSYTQQYTLQQIREHLQQLLVSERFLQSQIAGNGVPIYLCAYPINIHNSIQQLPRQFVQFLAPQGINAIHIDIYQIVLAQLQSRNMLQTFLEREGQINKNQLSQMLANVLNVEQYLMPLIKSKIDALAPQVIFIDGIGSVYPFIRAHTILNHLEIVTNSIPVVVFLPGSYQSSSRTGMTLNLFGVINDDNYYRAINIMEVK
jgi:hypothetical protein